MEIHTPRTYQVMRFPVDRIRISDGSYNLGKCLVRGKEQRTGEKGECRRYKRCEDSAGLAVTKTNERIDDKKFILLGNVKNSGKIMWTTVKVKAELFGKDNNVIDEYSEYVG